jgi:DNA-binding PadR family transcriptional regulator
MAHSVPPPIIPDRAEFVEALHLLRRGHVMVNVGEDHHGWAIDGSIVRHSARTLQRYGLVDEFENPEGFPGVRYFRITDRGREFAGQAWAAWRRRSLLERALVRLVG